MRDMSHDPARPYLITSLNEMPGKDRWVRSAVERLGESVQPVVIMWQPEFEVPGDWIVKKMPCRYPGHLDKLLPLLDMNLDPTRWFVFTDGSDVLFQTPLPDLAQAGHRVLLSHEGVRHRDCAFWHPHLRLPMYRELADAQIFNVGSWAAIGTDFREFVEFQQATRRLCERRGWAQAGYHDQLMFNLWVQANPRRCGELEGLFCTLYANLAGVAGNGDARARLIDGRFVTREGRPYAIVHANGSTKEILDRVVPPGPAEAAGRTRTGE
jgi:hypothetical protein